MVVLTEKFRFIRDDVFLCPWVDSETGKQKLIMQKINLETNEVEFEDYIDCIHTVVTDISPDQFKKIHEDSETQEKLLKKTLFIRSSENLREIELTSEEKFKALKSWVAGIAEFGLSALKVQFEIENSANLVFPIINRLFRFITKADPKFIYQYLSKIERECKFEGVNHKSSLIANLLPILGLIYRFPNRKTGKRELKVEDRKIMTAILSIDLPYELFQQNTHLIPLLFDFPDYFQKIKQKCTDKIVKLVESNLDENKHNSSIIENSTMELDVLRNMYEENLELIPEDEKFLTLIFEMEPH